jgi:hypothetical protein
MMEFGIKQCLGKCADGGNNSMSNEGLRKAILQDNAVPEVGRKIPTHSETVWSQNSC